MDSLRVKAVKGGAFLLVRQAIGIVVSVIGVLLVTRVIGPHQYGLFSAAAGIVTFLCLFGTFGLDVYLLRKTDEPEERDFQQAFTLLLIISAVLCLAVIALRYVLASYLRMPHEAPLLLMLSFALPLNILAFPAVVKLDRELNFKQVAINELASQVAYYVVAVPLAFRNMGAWAPAVGLLTQQAALLALSYWSARFTPKLFFERRLAARMLRYGLSYSSSVWVYQLRVLVNPVFVGRFAGAEAVGYVAVAVRIATLLSFAKDATWRLAIPALAKLNCDADKLRSAIAEGMRFQAIAVGLPLASFAIIAPFLVPLAFGSKWAPAAVVFPFVAVGCLTNAMFNLHSSVLYLLGRNMQVTYFHAVHIALFAGATVLLVPRAGIWGYGWAEIVALASYLAIHAFVVSAVGAPPYRAPSLWYAATACVIALGFLRSPVICFGFLVLLAPLLFRKERSTLLQYAQILRPGVRL